MSYSKPHIQFICHDPGGYDVVFPVYTCVRKRQNVVADFICTGPSKRLNEKYAVDEKIVLEKLEGTDLLVTGTSWDSNLELDAINICKKRGAITISILDFWSNYVARLFDGMKYVFPDYYFVMDDLARAEAIRDGINADIIRIIGHPGLDEIVAISKGIKRKTRDSIKNILILSQPISGLNGDSLGYTEQEVLEDALSICRKLNLSFHVLFHPKDSSKLKKKYKQYEVNGRIIDIATDYDVIIGMYTIGLLHSYLAGGHIISYQPGLRTKDLCVTNRLGITEGIYTYHDLELALSGSSKTRILSKLPIWADGCSADRAGSLILDLLNERKGMMCF